MDASAATTSKKCDESLCSHEIAKKLNVFPWRLFRLLLSAALVIGVEQLGEKKVENVVKLYLRKRSRVVVSCLGNSPAGAVMLC